MSRGTGQTSAAPQPIANPTPETPSPKHPGGAKYPTSDNPLCVDGPTPPGGHYPYFPSASATLDALVGTWMRCDNAPEGPGGPAGFEVTPEGHVYKLDFEYPGGNCIRIYGFQNERRLEEVAQGDSGFCGSALDMMLYAQGAHRYGRSAKAPIVPPVPPSGAQGIAGCGITETSLEVPKTADEARAALVRTWVACDGGSSQAGADGIDGIELAEDDTWYYLRAGVRATDAASHGT